MVSALMTSVAIRCGGGGAFARGRVGGPLNCARGSGLYKNSRSLIYLFINLKFSCSRNSKIV